MSSTYIDKELLINLVHMRPALWDKQSDIYKDKKLRTETWREIYGIMNKEFDDMNSMEQEVFGKEVIKTWTRIRDTWMKNLSDKANGRRPDARPFRYHNQMMFLKKVIDDFQIENDSEEDEANDSAMDGNRPVLNNDSNNEDELDGAEIPRKKKKTNEMVKIPDSVVTKTDTQGEDRHFAFFRSIRPTVSLFNDDQFLEYQYGVISLLRKIKNEQRGNEWVEPQTSNNVPRISQGYRAQRAKQSPSSD